MKNQHSIDKTMLQFVKNMLATHKIIFHTLKIIKNVEYFDQLILGVIHPGLDNTTMIFTASY